MAENKKSKFPSEADVVIVGVGGIVGSMLAYWLAEMGQKNIVGLEKSTIIPSGIAIFIENPEFAGIVIPRSGLGAKKGLVCGNLLGLIDSDYQGPLSISLWNRSNEKITINAGERVAQLVVIRVDQVDLEQVEDFVKTDRGSKGFGSTGIT